MPTQVTARIAISSGSSRVENGVDAVVPEEEEEPEDHEDVPLQRDREREGREDVEVEDDHPDDGDRADRPARWRRAGSAAA